jgi:hypothetical protein
MSTTETTEKPKTLRDGIASGHFDAVLDLLIEAAEKRKRYHPELVLEAQRAAGTAKTGYREVAGVRYEMGDIHNLVHHVKPKYISGARVQIVGFESKRKRAGYYYERIVSIKVKILSPVYGGKRFKAGDTVTVPPSMLAPKA